MKWHDFTRILVLPLWHGNAFRSLQVLENLCFDLEAFSHKDQVEAKLYKYVNEFYTYIKLNASFIPNYGDRYRNGEIISTSFLESTVNEIISKRMVKKQQMRWTKKGAHLLLQVRVKVLDEDLKKCFTKWYPGMEKEEMPMPLAA